LPEEKNNAAAIAQLPRAVVQPAAADKGPFYTETIEAVVSPNQVLGPSAAHPAQDEAVSVVVTGQTAVGTPLNQGQPKRPAQAQLSVART
jgi:hypothetical protein